MDSHKVSAFLPGNLSITVFASLYFLLEVNFQLFPAVPLPF